MRVNLKQNERVALVRGLFSRVAARYDLLNHLFSLGRDRFWRRAAAGRARTFFTHRILDLACGTGDLALALAEAHPGAQVRGLDFTRPMLVRAKEKIARAGLEKRIDLVAADALSLPFPDRSFDSVTIAFGIRNIPDRTRALSEMLRVLAPGGRALILELAFPRRFFIRRVYDGYLNRLIPRLGRLISGQALAYQYLADSIMDFPSPEELGGFMARCGFVRTGFKSYTFGVCTLHWGEKGKNPIDH
ncbi:MAG: bifunctional demethylmenaquinone methyltransferase/2-methoxy-6-polyprenyl-1,4-benzoquinol methylase UbiE [Thermodesulfobacteriota bacterium]